MKGPTNYNGMALPQQSAGAFGEATTGASAALNAGAGYAGQAGDMYSQFGGYMPSDVTTQTLANTDLSGYMNPFTRDVTNTTMDELRRQQQISDQGIRDQSMAAGAWGGDRMQVQQAENTRNYDDIRAKTLAALNQGNFSNAQQMAQTDLGRKLQADSANQNMRYGMSQAGAGGLANLGVQGMGQGMTSLGNQANMGFGFGNQLSQNQLAAGAINQKMMQSLIDAGKSQYSGWSNSPDQALNTLLQSLGINIGNAGTTKGTTTTPGPSTLDQITGAVGAVGSLLPW